VARRGPAVVRDTLTALDAVGLSRVVVAGHSWGAWTALRLAAEAPERVLAVVALDGGLSWRRRLFGDVAELRRRMTPPRTAVAVADLRALVRSGPLEPWWSPEVERAVLSGFEMGADGLARTRFPFDAHMTVVDDLLSADDDAVLDRVACPTWLVACSAPGDGGAEAARAAGTQRAAYDRAATRLARPRVLAWHGAVHDVPLQWPALVAGLVRAARDDLVRSAPRGEGAPA